MKERNYNQEIKDTFRLLNKYNKENYSVKQIAEELRLFSKEIISALFYYCLDNTLLEKLIEASILNEDNEINRLLEAINNGNIEAYLNSLDIETLNNLSNILRYSRLNMKRIETITSLIKANIDSRKKIEEGFLEEGSFKKLSL